DHLRRDAVAAAVLVGAVGAHVAAADWGRPFPQLPLVGRHACRPRHGDEAERRVLIVPAQRHARVAQDRLPLHRVRCRHEHDVVALEVDPHRSDVGRPVGPDDRQLGGPGGRRQDELAPPTGGGVRVGQHKGRYRNTLAAVGGRAPDDLAAAAALGGEMGRRVMAFDWASHPLGPLDQWPAPVRAVVATVLSSRFPVVVWLGEPLFLVYNDGYIPMLGTRHPSALGRPGHEVWWDIWDVVGPMLAGVVETGVATWSDDLHLNLVTGGHPEERYFTFTYSPIITDDGRVGVFCPVTETTARVLSERRLYFLNSLAGALMDAQTEEQVLQSTLDVVSAQHAVDVPAVAVYLDGATPDVRELRGATAGAHGRAPRSVAVDASGEPKVVEDDDGRAVEVGAASASLWLGLNPLRPFDEQYRSFARLLAGQVS